MKIYKLHELSDLELSGEYTFDLSSDSGLSISYLRFRETGEKKPLKLKNGFKGVVHVIKGELRVTNGSGEVPIGAGETFKLDSDIELSLTNSSSMESIVLVATGPSTKKALEDVSKDNSIDSDLPD